MGSPTEVAISARSSLQLGSPAVLDMPEPMKMTS